MVQGLLARMEVERLLVVEAQELGIDVSVAVELAKILEPVVCTLKEPEDLGLYYFSEARCVNACAALGKQSVGDGSVLLWHVAQNARSVVRGSIGVDYLAM